MSSLYGSSICGLSSGGMLRPVGHPRANVDEDVALADVWQADQERQRPTRNAAEPQPLLPSGNEPTAVEQLKLKIFFSADLFPRFFDLPSHVLFALVVVDVLIDAAVLVFDVEAGGRDVVVRHPRPRVVRSANNSSLRLG